MKTQIRESAGLCGTSGTVLVPVDQLRERRGRDVSGDQDQKVSLSHFLNSYDPSLAAV